MNTPSLDVFQVVADRGRRQMLHLLSKDTLTINALARHFDMSRPAVSKHVHILHRAGFIRIRDIGRERYCTLRREGFIEMQSWISYFDSFWTKKLHKLESLLDDKGKEN